jgi:cation diffusion facilitator CzcD-associated flavoprotein CzcO
VDVAIIGSGPYGLSLAAHLRGGKRSFRVFGEPMRSWTHHMPRGMSLKSEGFASDLYDPAGEFPLKTFCSENNIPYGDVAVPVKNETFIAYGLEFQRRYVPTLEKTQIVSLAQDASGFVLKTAAGELVYADQVVIAAGIIPFAYMPPPLAAVNGGLVTHSSKHSDLSEYKGKRVGVIGAGASAVDIAVELREMGAQPELIARTPTLHFNPAPREPRSLLDSIKAPRSGLGTGWRSRLASDIPQVFYALPESLRHRAVARHLGPAPCWFTKDAVVGKLPVHLGTSLLQTVPNGKSVRLQLRNGGPSPIDVEYDHVIAATGYRVAVSKLTFIDQSLQSKIRQAAETPLLDRQFESSVPGLFFVGITAANNFGPLLRFAFGAKFAAKRLAKRLNG